MNSALSRQKRRRHRRKMRRGYMDAPEATALSKRTRSQWPQTKAQTRYHRYKWTRKPRKKWRQIEDEYEREAS